MVPEEKRKVRVVIRVLGENGSEDQVFYTPPVMGDVEGIEQTADTIRKAESVQMEVTNGQGGVLILHEAMFNRTLFFIEYMD